MTDVDWIGAALTAARPQAVAALLRYFRDLDTAEEAFQEASLRALKTWPRTGPPRDPAAWLIFVGRNVAIDSVRHRARQEPLPRRRRSTSKDAEAGIAESIDFLPLQRRRAAAPVRRRPAIPSCPERSRSRSASRVVWADLARQIARAFHERGGDGAAHHARQALHRRRGGTVRGAGRGRAGATLWRWRR